MEIVIPFGERIVLPALKIVVVTMENIAKMGSVLAHVVMGIVIMEKLVFHALKIALLVVVIKLVTLMRPAQHVLLIALSVVVMETVLLQNAALPVLKTVVLAHLRAEIVFVNLAGLLAVRLNLIVL